MGFKGIKIIQACFRDGVAKYLVHRCHILQYLIRSESTLFGQVCLFEFFFFFFENSAVNLQIKLVGLPFTTEPISFRYTTKYPNGIDVFNVNTVWGYVTKYTGPKKLGIKCLRDNFSLMETMLCPMFSTVD